MKKDLRNFPFRIVIHERQSAQPILDWLDRNIRHDRWTMGIRNIEMPRSDQSAPFVDMVIHFARSDDMELFREKWAGESRQRRVKLKFIRAALFALTHPRADMVFYETLSDADNERNARAQAKAKAAEKEKNAQDLDAAINAAEAALDAPKQTPSPKPQNRQ
ncbi:hypothetical protein [Thalassospira sp. MCCC 1A01428]|uniref:hypothetical protein n=1 Tax=unclassified Thalassospira TaxID=2648997 RepID=UPI001AEF3F86|nr:hypothetical protein [Thalassospira sp. MCCC 1A01428]